MAEGVQITGLTETIRAIVDVPKNITRNGLSDALVAGSAVIQRGLLEKAPRRKTPVTSEREFPPLSESVVTFVEIDQNKLEGIAQTGFGESGPVALWNEYGHRIVTRSKVDTGRTTEPNPFMRATADQLGEEAIEAAAKSLQGFVRATYR
jgi:hypothetical protein